VIGGVDTHLDTHVTAALDGIGGLLTVQQFPATLPGYQALLGRLVVLSAYSAEKLCRVRRSLDREGLLPGRHL
jgi:hypothetical protein